LLVLQRVPAGDHAAGTVAEEEDLEPRLSRLDHVDERREIGVVVLELLDEEALAPGAATAAVIQGIDGEALGNELLGDPFVLAAVCVESMGDDDHGAGLARGSPLAREDLDSTDACEGSFS